MRRDRPLPRALRGARRRARRARGDRREPLVPRRRSLAAGLPDGASVLVPEIDFTSLTWPLPRAGEAARRPVGAARRARRRHRLRDGRRRLQRRAVRRRRGRRSRRHRRGGRHPRDVHGRGRLAGRQLAARSTAPGSTPSPAPPTSGSCRRAARPSSRSRSARSSRRRRWPPTGSPPTTASAATTTTTCASPTTPGGSTSHRRGSPGSAPSRPCAFSPRSASTRSTTTTSASRTGFETASACRRRTPRSCPRTCRAPKSGSSAPASVAAVRGGALRASFHLYNTEDDVDAALSALLD